MPRLRLSLLFVFGALTLLFLSLRIEIVDSSSASIIDIAAGLRRGSKNGGENVLGITSLLFDHGSLSSTTSHPTILKVAGPPSATGVVFEHDLTTTSSAPQTRLTDLPSLETGVPNATSSSLTQEEFQKEHDAIASVGAIFGHTLNKLETPHADYTIKHPEALLPSNDTVAYSDVHPNIYNPYLDRTSTSRRSRDEGSFVPCNNPWANADAGSLRAFLGHPKGFPEPSFGSYEALDIDGGLCFERETRLGQYGDGNSVAIDWETVDWGLLQQQCVTKNAARYTATAGDKDTNSSNHRTITRTAVILRSYADRKYTASDKINIRSLINELALGSGGEYQVFLLVETKNSSDIWADEELYNQAIQSLIPREFWNMTELWGEKVVRGFYPMIPKNATGVHQSHWLAIQRFSHLHPEFEYYWDWEMDARYTGHHYDLLEKLAHFAKAQPRKGLWERNERFYIPLFHGAYNTSFREWTGHVVWQPPEVEGVTPLGPDPPATQDDDDYEWGVGEEADYITLGPIFDPNGTAWAEETIWGYGNIPRRATVLTQSRCSRHLLDAMHMATLQGKHMGSGMAPQTTALLHGLKAVYAPHPVFFDRAWPPARLAQWFNPGPRGESGSHIESAFGRGRDGRFSGCTWYYRAVVAMKLYNNWMGLGDDVGGDEWENANGRMCLPPMLLHPVKGVGAPA